MDKINVEDSGVPVDDLPLGEKLEVFGSVVGIGGLALLSIEKLVDWGVRLPTIVEVPIRALGSVAAVGGSVSIVGGMIHDMVTGRTF